MRKLSKSNRSAARMLPRRYASALRGRLNGSGEMPLRQAYEVGRSALSAGFGVLDMAQLHLDALGELLKKVPVKRDALRTLKVAEEICLESLAPYEMAHRGFREANVALRHLNDLLEQEAQRLARELHDEAGQMLAVAHLALDDATQDLPDTHKQRLNRVKNILAQIEIQLRRISHELRPLVLDDLGLEPALRFLAEGISKRAGLAIATDAACAERFPPQIEFTLYRIVQEALNNAAKHAQARHVKIEVRRQGNFAACSVQDDGKGFDISRTLGKARRGLGLIGMRERASSLGGRIDIYSKPGKGSRIQVRLPLGS